MYTEHDERQGLVKTNWANVRERVHKVNPEFATLVDEVDPGKDMPLFLAYYPYGDLIGDTTNPLMPKMDGGQYRLTENEAPKEIFQHLGYASNSIPLGIALEKNFEVYMDLKNKNITIPIFIYKPGNIFPLPKILNIEKTKNYVPNGLLEASSGFRSVCMLPYIGCMIQHCNLQRDFNIKTPVTKFSYEHWALFKELANCKTIQSTWKSCLLYFSDNWINKIMNNASWHKIKLFLYQYDRKATEFKRNQFYYEFIFSILQERTNLKPNPYLMDTAKYLFKIALGEAIGFEPCTDENALPLKSLQKIFLESYGLKKYIPTIMIPGYQKEKNPIYYSLQHPITDVFSPKSAKESTALNDLRELSRIIQKLKIELSDKSGLCPDTAIYQIANNIDFNYFHHKEDDHKIIKPSIEIIKLDDRFSISYKRDSSAIFSQNSKFFRGCVKISNKLIA